MRVAVAALSAVTFALAAIVPYVADPSYSAPFTPGVGFAQDRFKGIYPAEITAQGSSFSWTNGVAEIVLPDVDRHTSWHVHLRAAAGAWPEGSEAPTLDVTIDGRTAISETLSADFTEITATAQPRPERRGLTVGLISPAFVPGPQDARRLGIVLSHISVEPAGWAFPPLRAAAASLAAGALLAAAAFASGLQPRLMVLGLALLGFVAGSLLRFGSAADLSFAGPSWRLAAGVAIPTIAALAVGWFGKFTTNATRIAIAASMALMYLKLLIVFHPDMIVGDTIFHLNRFKRVLSGTYYFTSVAPGGDFPYPVALYVVASWLRWITDDWVSLLRAIVSCADAAAGLAVFGVARRVASDRAGFIALASYHLTPAVFQVHGTAYLTNAFGQAMAAVALYGVATLPATMLSWRMAGTVLAVTIALLSHLSSAAILFVSVAMTSLVFLKGADETTRRAARAVGVALVTAAALSTLLYWGHFGQTYRVMVTQPSLVNAPPDGSVPEQRREAHQTTWAPGWPALLSRAGAVPGYVQKYLGWSQVLLAMCGAWVLWGSRARDRITLLLAGWMAACAGFLALGVLTPIDMRYYLAVAPPLAILSAVAVNWAFGREWQVRAGVAAIYTWFVAAGLWYWMAWLSSSPPR